MRNHQTHKASCVTFTLILLCFGIIHSSHAESVISEQDIEKAKALFSGPTEADYYKTDELLTSATGSLKPVFFAPSVATVITKDEIEAIGATTLDEVLETVPGLHVSVDSYNAFSTNWIIRGVRTDGTPQVLMLVNGVPVTEAFTGSKPANLYFPVSMISRVEIVRGPGSAVHGADAFSGTINVVTMDGQEIDGTRGGARLGSFGREDAWAQHGGIYNNWDIGIGIDYLSSDGDTGRIVDKDQQTVFDGLFSTSASQAPGPLRTQYKVLNTHISAIKNRWNAQLWYSRQRDIGGGSGIANALNDFDDINTDALLSSVKYSNNDLLKNWLLDFRFDYKYHKKDSLLMIFPQGTTVPIGSDGNLFTGTNLVTFTDGVIGQPIRMQNQFAHETTATYTGLAQHNFRFAVGYQYTKVKFESLSNFGPGVIDGTVSPIDGTLTSLTGTPYIYSPDTNRRLYYLSAQDEWALNKTLELTAGIRYDDYSDFGNTVNPRAALVWQAQYDFVTKLLYGRAFRAPAFAELNAQNNPVGLGNTNLDPETIDTIELVLDYRPTVDIRLASNFFYYKIDGLIELVNDVGGTKRFQNFRDQKAHGVELEAGWHVNSKLKVNGNVAWVKPTDEITNKTVPDIPQLQAYANINYVFLPHTSISGQWYWIGNRTRAPGDTRKDIGDYHLVNLTLRRKEIAGNTNLAFAIRNAFDEDVREPAVTAIPNDYPMNGREAWAEIKVKF